MKNLNYVGHTSQILGVEEHRLVGGKGDGMRLFEVRNGRGLEFTISADRCADISRLSFKGFNMGYFSPSGYVAPQYYDRFGTNFLKSFTAGFLTTCGLVAVGNPGVDIDGEEMPMHGNISHFPAEWVFSEITEKEIIVRARMQDETLFGRKLTLNRKISCSHERNEIKIDDIIENEGAETSPLMYLYHMNVGYPLLSEKAKVYISSGRVIPRNDHAAEGIDSWNVMLPPTKNFEEQCYYHSFNKDGLAAIYNPDIDMGLVISFDAERLDHFIEWKMMGERDYVLGLEPGNCHADGRVIMREQGTLKYIEPGEKISYGVKIRMLDGEIEWLNLAK